MCLNNTHLTFSFTILANQETVLKSIDDVTQGIFSVLGYSHGDKSIITFANITSGLNSNTDVDGFITPFEGSQQYAEQVLSSGLLLQGIQGFSYSITNIRVGNSTINGTSPANFTTNSTNSSNNSASGNYNYANSSSLNYNYTTNSSSGNYNYTTNSSSGNYSYSYNYTNSSSGNYNYSNNGSYISETTYLYTINASYK